MAHFSLSDFVSMGHKNHFVKISTFVLRPKSIDNADSVPKGFIDIAEEGFIRFTHPSGRLMALSSFHFGRTGGSSPTPRKRKTPHKWDVLLFGSGRGI